MLRLALLGKVVTAGDDVSLLPQDVLPDAAARTLVEAARRSLANTRRVRLDQHAAHRGRPARARPDAGAGHHGHRRGLAGRAAHPRPTARPAARARRRPTPDGTAPGLDDLPGLRGQAQRADRTARPRLPPPARCSAGWAPTVSLGVLVTGRPGSGKSALVRAVAAAVERPGRAAVGAGVAALTNDAAAGRLRAAVARPPDSPPAVLLVADVEALAPRDEPGPLATVFRQVLADAGRRRRGRGLHDQPARVGRPGAARARTCSRWRSRVPLPDAALRREQLAVLTRAMPLADDVRLDDVAARTPGFVAADLAALAREAGVRAALRQKAGDRRRRSTMADFDGGPGGGPADVDGRRPRWSWPT